MRCFKPGDRVKQKSGGPQMIVQRYAKAYRPWVGWYQSDNLVECSWYDPDEGYKTGVFHQNNLVPQFRFIPSLTDAARKTKSQHLPN